MRKNVIVLVLITCGALNSFGQKGDFIVDDKSNFTDRLYFGGGLGLSSGSQGTSISLAPIVGYMVSNRLSVGVGVKYEYYSVKNSFYNYTDNRYGGNVFARMNLFKQIFAYGEYSFLNYSYLGDSNDRRTAYRLPIGLGFSQSVGPRSSFNVVAAYDMLYELNGPYASPWVIGFYFAL